MYEGLPTPVACSVGVASASEKAGTKHLVRAAGEVLYPVKDAGRD